MWWTIQFSAFLAAIIEILDVAALHQEDFDIVGGFKATWRAHAWEGDEIYGYFVHQKYILLINWDLLQRTGRRIMVLVRRDTQEVL